MLEDPLQDRSSQVNFVADRIESPLSGPVEYRTRRPRSLGCVGSEGGACEVS